MCFNILGSKKDSINPLGKLTTSLPDILRNLFSPPTHTPCMCVHSTRPSLWEHFSGKPQANNWLHITLHQAPSLTGFLTQSSSSLFSDYRSGTTIDESLMGVDGDLLLKKEKGETNTQVWNLQGWSQRRPMEVCELVESWHPIAFRIKFKILNVFKALQSLLKASLSRLQPPTIPPRSPQYNNTAPLYSPLLSSSHLPFCWASLSFKT